MSSQTNRHKIYGNFIEHFLHVTVQRKNHFNSFRFVKRFVQWKIRFFVLQNFARSCAWHICNGYVARHLMFCNGKIKEKKGKNLEIMASSSVQFFMMIKKIENLNFKWIQFKEVFGEFSFEEYNRWLITDCIIFSWMVIDGGRAV